MSLVRKCVFKPMALDWGRQVVSGGLFNNTMAPRELHVSDSNIDLSVMHMMKGEK
jgi:hypothetical protein